MGTVRGSYPHPVLDATDDVASTIEVFNVRVTPSVDDVELSFQVRMTDPNIRALIDEGKAKFIFRWRCSSTIASGGLGATPAKEHADSTTYVGWIDQQDVRNTVRVEIKIVATSTIHEYRLDNQHIDYGDAAFSLSPGDILADAGYFEFEPKKLYDPLQPPLGSCFRFVANSKVKKGVKVRFDDDDYVLVEFREEVLQGFGSLANRPDLQVSLVVLPALMQTIEFIKGNLYLADEGEDLTDKKWYQSIHRLVGEAGSWEEHSFDVAQKVLGHSLEDSLTKPLMSMEDE